MKKPGSKNPARGRLKPMRVSEGFSDFVLDQLAGLADLEAKPMFGGIGLYAGDVFFGIVAADVLYLKVGDANRADYERAGAEPFAPYPTGKMSTSYYSVPAGVLEDSRTLVRWVTRSIDAARRARRITGKRRRGA